MKWKLVCLTAILSFESIACATKTENHYQRYDEEKKRSEDGVSWEEMLQSLWNADYMTEFREFAGSLKEATNWESAKSRFDEKINENKKAFGEWFDDVTSDPAKQAQYVHAFADFLNSWEYNEDDEADEKNTNDGNSWTSWLFGTDKKEEKKQSKRWKKHFSSWSKEDVIRHGREFVQEVLSDEETVRNLMVAGLAAAGTYVGGSLLSSLIQSMSRSSSSKSGGGGGSSNTSAELVKLHQLWENSQTEHARLYKEWMALDDAAHAMSMSDPRRRRALERAQEMREQVDEAKQHKKRIEWQIEQLTERMKDSDIVYS